MTTVDRRAVQELIEARIARHTRMRPNDYDKGYEDALEVLLVELAELPSSNAQAVAWQWRLRGKTEWMECFKSSFDRRHPDYEFRALCVCSGDAKEADK